jgi:hypothetical protein
MNKWTLAAFAVLLLGSVFALPQNVTVTPGATGNYTRQITSTGSTVMEGGNVTEANLSGSYSTEKWGAFYGNVTGGLRLAQSMTVAPVYEWSWDISNGGEVCASLGTNPAWSSVGGTDANAIDTWWGFATTDIDSATQTFTTTASYDFSGGPSGTTVGAYTYDDAGTDTWETFALNTSTGGVLDLVFCVNISPGSNRWDAVAGGYQLMVPANESFGVVETYYFFVELQA